MAETTITVLATVVTACATVVIAIYAWKNHRLTDELKKQSEGFNQQFNDLLEAIVIATTVAPSGGGRGHEFAIENFKKLYNTEERKIKLFE